MTASIIPNRSHMHAALSAARESFAAGDYAVGSSLTFDGNLIAASGNRTHLDGDPTQHAEMIVIREAAKRLGRKDLSGCVLYATHEPCPMCMGAIIWARITSVVYGATMSDHKDFRDAVAGSKWRWRVLDVPASYVAERGEPRVEHISGFMRAECLQLFHS